MLLLVLLCGLLPNRAVADEGNERKAQWIWTSDEQRPEPLYAYFRTTFELEQIPRQAELMVFAAGGARVYVNGRFAGMFPTRDYSFNTPCSVNISDLLLLGRNTVAVLAGRDKRMLYFYSSGFSYPPISPTPGLWLQVDMELPNGEKMTVSSDETWKSLPASDLSDDMKREYIIAPPTSVVHEIMDARLSPKVQLQPVDTVDDRWRMYMKYEDWTLPAYGDDAWPKAYSQWPAYTISGDGFPLMPAVACLCPTVQHALPVEVTDYYIDPNERPATTYFSTVYYIKDPEKAQTRDPVELSPILGQEPDNRAGARLTVPEGHTAVFTLDFGRTVDALPRLRVQSETGGETLELSFSDSMEKTVTFTDSSGEKKISIPAFLSFLPESLRYTTREGIQEYTGFHPRSFRYMRVAVSGVEKPLFLIQLSAVEIE